MPDDQPDLLELAHELARRVLENPREKGRIIKAFHAEQVAAHNKEGADFALTMHSIHRAREEPNGNSLPVALPQPGIARTPRWRRAWIFIVPVVVAVGILSYAVLDRRGSAVTEQGPHPAFWNKLPAPGHNNVWYDNHNPTTVFIFVHGIFSDSRGCWLYESPKDPNKAQYWPELLTTDKRFEQPAIFLGGYATSMDSGPYDTRQAAGELRDAIKREGVLTRERVIFIAHSTGGIVVRFLLVHNQDLFRGKMIGLVLYASPSKGARLANELGFLTKFYGNKLGAQLQEQDTFLTDLDNDFRDLLYNPNSEPNNLRIVGAEGVENFFIVHRRLLPDDTKVVPEDSASRYFGAPVYLRGTDHFSTVKPDTVNHPGHQLLLSFYSKFKSDFGLMNKPGPQEPAFPAAKLPTYNQCWQDEDAKRYTQALQCYEVIAKKGDPNAMASLANLYDSGFAGTVNYDRAQAWYEQAAKMGNPNAMTNLGYMHEIGHLPRDYSAARQWYQQAADLGEVRAMYRLGLFCENGYAGPVDLIRARSWYQKAAALGLKEAREALVGLRPLSKPSQ